MFTLCDTFSGQVAVAFAAMHDTPARMLAVGVLQGVVPWRSARTFFVQRLRRRCEASSIDTSRF